MAHRRRAERIDDDYRLALPVDPLVEQRTFVVRALQLERLVTGDVVGAFAIGGGLRMLGRFVHVGDARLDLDVHRLRGSRTDCCETT